MTPGQWHFYWHLCLLEFYLHFQAHGQVFVESVFVSVGIAEDFSFEFQKQGFVEMPDAMNSIQNLNGGSDEKFLKKLIEA